MPSYRSYGLPPALPGPVKFPLRNQRDPKVLSLIERAFLRRLAKGESITDIARELQVAASSSRNFRRRLREVFEVNDDQELLAHPDIIRQIKEED